LLPLKSRFQVRNLTALQRRKIISGLFGFFGAYAKECQNFITDPVSAARFTSARSV